MRTESLLIKPGLSEKHYWRDLWNYRELFLVLAWRDVAVRYKQTVVGLAWAILQPLTTMFVFVIVFGRLAKFPTEGDAPYALMVLAGMLPWQFFASSLTGASTSLIGNSNLVSKVYFPRLIVPASSVVVAFVDFLFGFLLLLAMMVFYRFWPGWQVLTLPLFLLMAFLASLGPGLWLSSLNVKYRDFRYVIPFLVQFGLYVSPVGFSSSIVPEKWRMLYSLNPMVGVIEGFRWALLGGGSGIHLKGFLLSWGVIVFFLWIGIRQFRKMEKSFADLI